MKNKNIFKTIGMFTLTAGLIVLLTGCGHSASSNSGSAAPKTVYHETASEITSNHIAVVVGAHANAQKYDFSVLDEPLEHICRNAGSVGIFIDDGKPSSVANVDIPALNTRQSTKKQNSTVSSYKTQLTSALSSLAAIEPEADPLTALRIACRDLHSSTDGEAMLYMFDTGICTVDGCLDMRGGLENLDVDTTVQKLSEQHEIPNLSNIIVKWTGLADVSDPQEALSESDRANLKALYRAIIEEGNGTVIFTDDLCLSESYDANTLPSVTTIPVISEVNAITTEHIPDIVRLGEAQLNFKSNSSEFLDADSAAEILRPFAVYMQTHQDYQLLIAGCTASGNLTTTQELSEQRAEAAKSLLVNQLGAPESSIRTVGLGCQNRFHISDLNKQGQLIESAASKNRVIYCIRFDSATAQSILEEIN